MIQLMIRNLQDTSALYLTDLFHGDRRPVSQSTETSTELQYSYTNTCHNNIVLLTAVHAVSNVHGGLHGYKGL